jgi:hypothetical protein
MNTALQEHYLVITLKPATDEADILTPEGEPMEFDTFKRFVSPDIEPVMQYADTLDQAFVIMHTKSVLHLLEQVSGLSGRGMTVSITGGLLS